MTVKLDIQQFNKTSEPSNNSLRLSALELQVEAICPVIDYLVEELAFYRQRLSVAEQLLLRVLDEKRCNGISPSNLHDALSRGGDKEGEKRYPSHDSIPAN